VTILAEIIPVLLWGILGLIYADTRSGFLEFRGPLGMIGDLLVCLANRRQPGGRLASNSDDDLLPVTGHLDEFAELALGLSEVGDHVVTVVTKLEKSMNV
jgi:hypothetical protein